ncbi:MAG: DUF177 domain-containing protein [Clostridia bacterium]|nr:DUF177 domain-containing protein [Clostridia bacterium]
MRIDVESLRGEKGASVSLDLVEEFLPLDLQRSEIRFMEPLRFVGQATNTGQRIVITGYATGRGTATCDRCLGEFTMDFHVPFAESYYRRDEAPSAVDEDEGVYDGEVIDIGPEVEKAILLSLPFRIVCKEECRGLCPTCGKDLNLGECGCAGNDRV